MELNAAGLVGVLVVAVSARWLRARDRRRLLERTRALFVEWSREDAEGRDALRYELERSAAVVGRAVREAPVDPARLSFFAGEDRHDYFGAGEVSVLDNFLAPRESVRREFVAALDEALAHFRARERASLSPAGWLRTIVFLPREVLRYVGLHSEGSRGLVTWIQLLYWCVAVLCAAAWAWSRFGPLVVRPHP